VLVNGVGGWFETAGVDTAAFFADNGELVGAWMSNAADDTGTWITSDFVGFVSLIGGQAGDWVEADFVNFFESGACLLKFPQPQCASSFFFDMA
jgi:hypothetical protein